MVTQVLNAGQSITGRTIVAGPAVSFTVVDDAAFPLKTFTVSVGEAAVSVPSPASTPRADGRHEAVVTLDLTPFNPARGALTGVKVRARVRSLNVDKSATLSHYNAPPTAAFTVSMNGYEATFDASGSSDDDPGLTYEWCFDIGAEGEARSWYDDMGDCPSHTYPENGDYLVLLIVTDDAGQQHSKAQNITVYVPGWLDEAPLGPDGTMRTCRIPRDQLTRVSGAEITRQSAVVGGPMPDISGCLVTGAVKIGPAGLTGTDFIVQADRDVQYLLERTATNPVLSHGLITGLQRDDDGEPVALHRVMRLVYQGITIDHCVSEYGNDGFGMASNSRMLNCVTRARTKYMLAVTRNGVTTQVEQHRDSAQMQQGGGQVVRNTIADLRQYPMPTRKDGVEVRCATYPLQGSAGFMINHDAPITGLVIFEDNTQIGGSSVFVNIAGGIDPGETLPWWELRYDADGNPVRGLIIRNNVVEKRSGEGVVRAPKAWLRKFVPNWSATPGPSTAFSVRQPDGALGNMVRGDLLPTESA